MVITQKYAKQIGDEIGIDFNVIDLEQFTKGINVELEHGSDPQTDIEHGDCKIAGKIAWAHLKESPDYYKMLDAVEKNLMMNEIAMHMINLPDVLQSNDYGCGVYVAQAIMAYYGEDWWEPELEKELHVDPEFGTPIKDLIKFFKSNQLKVYAGEFTIAKLKATLDSDIPVIMLIQAWDRDSKKDLWMNEEYGHYVIAIGYTDTSIIFEDPAMFGRGYINFSELEKRWHGEDEEVLRNFGIAVWGKKPFNFTDELIHID